MHTPHILLFGRDPILLSTRVAILNKEGYSSESVSSLRELKTCLAGRNIDLLVLCHSLSKAEASVAESIAVSFLPAVRLLALGSAVTEDLGCRFAQIFNTKTGPDMFRSTVQRSLAAHPPKHSAERRIDMPPIGGAVKWFNNAKGYGFLGQDDGGSDMYVHYSGIQHDSHETLKEGEAAMFDGD